MGIKFYCPNGHKVNVKSFLAGKKGLCPKCGVRVDIPLESVGQGGTKSALNASQGTSTADDVDDEDDADDISEWPSTALPVSAASQTPHTATYTLANERPAGDDLSDAPAAFDASGSNASAVDLSPHNIAPNSLLPLPAARVANPDDTLLPASAVPTDFRINSDALWQVQLATGQQFEAVDDATLQKWIAKGRISPDDMLWRDGWPHWQSAITVFPHWNRTAVPPSALPMPTVTPQSVPMTVRTVDDPLGDAVRSAAALPASATWLRQRYRGKREIRATLSLVLLGLVILLFALLLYVFFGREQPESKQTSLRMNAVFAAASEPRYLPPT